jgi:hypothetical protein
MGGVTQSSTINALSFDEETLTFLVEGCFWACPYEVYKIKLDSIEEPTSIEYTYCRDA